MQLLLDSMKDVKLFYSTEEVAEHFEVAPSKIRYYEREFNSKIQIRGKNKAFTKKDMAKIGEIISLIDEQNYTIQGAKEQLRSKKSKTAINQDIIERLQFVKEVLVKIKG